MPKQIAPMFMRESYLLGIKTPAGGLELVWSFSYVKLGKLINVLKMW
jgi:hypothetical protein